MHRSCYSSAPVAIPTCISTILAGRKRRESRIEEEAASAVDQDGNPVDFSKIISASKVGLSFEAVNKSTIQLLPFTKHLDIYKMRL